MPPKSKRRPLLGMTILLVEDSRVCSQAVRLMTTKTGARLRRADCLKSAHKHLSSYRPELVIVDLGLPDGSGLDLIAQLTERNIPTLAISGHVDQQTRALAMNAGAGGFLPKPVNSAKHFLETIKAVVEGSEKMPGFTPVVAGEFEHLDKQALMDDLEQVEKILTASLPENDMGQVRYCAQFVASIAQTTHDTDLESGAAAFFSHLNERDAVHDDGEAMLKLVQEKLNTIPDSIFLDQRASG